MANEEKKSITISKNNTGFPAYLDFDKLRSEGIAYLGKLSGQLWTDHNVHDPGITIFESLCYAVLDLGYRTSLPVEDLLARNPAEKSKDNNFFTPAQILTCNPLTIKDYRKLLIDIPGVKNAWLKAATDIIDRCRYQYGREEQADKQNATVGVKLDTPNELEAENRITCSTFLNGLYHVYIEPEEDLKEGSEKWNELLKRVKETLMAHRNLCEDFEDIFMLCKMDTGVCATIELEENADAENVYLAIATKLREFLSPAPKFYTLPELLEKGKSMEDIFSGRPYSKESHGFVDTDELEQIPLRKELHTSDIYTAIFEVEGVKKISRIKLQNCSKECEADKNTPWKFHMPKNHIPSFSLACSGFEFTRNGMRVEIDTEKFETLLELTFTHSGKVLHEMPSPYLDRKIPNGIYHSDLGDYYSIQNDFPQVYGIAEGSLPNDASDQRKAWALQLKGYLLFFDQMLANYLAQLKNIRQLFSLGSPATKKERHSYFLNKLTTVPEFGKLLRFGEENDNTLGTTGAPLVFPVSKKDWEKDWAKENIKLYLAEEVIAAQVNYNFPTLGALHDATSLLRDDLLNEDEIKVTTYQTADECWLFTIASSSEDYILLGKKISGTETQAMQHALSVQYTGVFEDNYYSFISVNGHFTFNIELNIVSYTNYMGLLVEDEDLYIRRRKQFLSHLLSRFSEKFTDFVLLNWESGYEQESITGVERFLTHFDDLSRNRGRAYDYVFDGWHNDNLSGFEKKVKALAGIENWQKKDLCNFTVDLYDEQYVIDFSKAGRLAFTVAEKYDLFDDAVKAAAEVIKAMANPANYKYEYLPDTKQYRLQLKYGIGGVAVYPRTFDNSNDVDHLIAYLSNTLVEKPAEDIIYEHSWTWKATLHAADGTIVKTAAEVWHTEEEATAAIAKLAEKINDDKKWGEIRKPPVSSELYYHKTDSHEKKFVDIGAFNIDINDTIIGKPGKFIYDVLDKEANSFKLSPVNEFATAKQAKEHCCRVVASSSDNSNFSISVSKTTKRYAISVLLDGKPEAMCTTEYDTRAEAEKAVSHIITTINKYSYQLNVTKTPETWKFSFPLGYDKKNIYLFNSDSSYNSPEQAVKAATEFQKSIGDINIVEAKNKITLAIAKNKNVSSVTYVAHAGDAPLPADEIKKELSQLQELVKTTALQTPEKLKEYVKVYGVGQFNTYVYRLVNKGHVPAVYTAAFSSEALAKGSRRAIAARTKNKLAEIPEICMGGDIFQEIRDKENVKWYRYQVKLYQLKDAPVTEIVLFESVEAYATKESAGKAFMENYLHILRFAMDKEEYGKAISIIPVPLKEKGECTANGVIAYIPKETLAFLEKEIGNNWKEGLSEYLVNYPVKIIDGDSPGFAALFCRDYRVLARNCSDKKINWLYYFSIPMRGSSTTARVNDEWRSTRYFETADAAIQEFRYFSRLLKFTGNYYVECACTKELLAKDQWKDPEVPEFTITSDYKIAVREVLAQSINWYQREEDAWGRYGIEKFICAVQSGTAFKNYLRKEDCCYSFYTVCGNGLLEHPCTYDTEQQRDDVIERLHKYFIELYGTTAFGTQENQKTLLLHDSNGQPFAQVITQTIDPKEFCYLKIILSEFIASKKYEIQVDTKGLFHIQWLERNVTIQAIQPVNTDIEAALKKLKQEWHAMLLKWACYYPITRIRIENISKRIDTSGQLLEENGYKYCIEIKLPGFNTCADDEQIDVPCSGCNDKPAITEPACYTAWKSPCCFATCAEAAKALGEALKYLTDKKNYQPVFDCTCHIYGISLHVNNPVLFTPDGIKTPESNEKGIPDINIIAANPQCYDSPDQVCKAVETAIKLVDSEGMHLVEHILLRPHCYDECYCRYGTQPCSTGCAFDPYPSDSTDPCTEQPDNICFEPGSDPYSFIATIALPEWSHRFRQPNTREGLEKVLYQEAPAHILLRILWLKPHDLWRFERLYKKWGKWLAGKDNCHNGFKTCDMFELVMRQAFDCPNETCDCDPCTEPGEKQRVDCENEKEMQTEPFIFLNQVNDTYCLPRYCKEYDGGYRDETFYPERKIEAKPAAAQAGEMVAVKTQEIGVKKKALPEAKKEAALEPVKTVLPESELKPTVIQLKAKVVNARLTRYRNVAINVSEHSKGNPVAAKLQSFFAAVAPSADALEKVVTEIIQNAKPVSKKAKILTRDQQSDLLEAAVCHYLDKVCFNGKDEPRISALQKITALMNKAGIDMQSIYNKWDAAEVEKYEPGIDTDYIRFVITGKIKD